MPATSADSAYLAGWLQRAEADAETAANWRAAIWPQLGEVAKVLVAQGAKRVILLGSLARDEASSGSDIDLWVEGLPAAQWLAASVAVGRLVPMAPVDIVRAETAGATLAARAAAEGRVLYG